MTLVEATLRLVPTSLGGHRGHTPSPLVGQRLGGPVAPPPPPPAPPARLGPVAAIVAAGIFLDGLADALARTGHAGPVVPLFLAGLVVIFVPCAWRLTSPTAARRERIGVGVVLGVGLLVSYILRSPLIFDGFDELIHGSNLSRMLDNHTLIVPNTVLPVSSYYPGLEMLTSAVKVLTGLPMVLSQMVVLLSARIVLVLCVFLVVERVCGSARAGGLGVLVYAANPEFYAFDAGYAYETLALALAAATVYLVMAAIDEARRRRGDLAAPSFGDSMRQLMVPRSEVLLPAAVTLRPIELPVRPPSDAPPRPMARSQVLRVGRDLGLGLACLMALVVTHHLTSWLAVAFLVVGAVALHRTGPRLAARVVTAAAVVGVVGVAMWTPVVGHRLVAYLGPIFSGAASGIWAAIGHGSSRPLFHSAAGARPSPTWEIVVMLGAAVAWCLVLALALRSAIRGRTVRGGQLRWVPVAIAAAYPVALVSRISSSSSEVGGRSMAFVFFGMAVVVGGWLATRVRPGLRLHWRGAILAIASVCFLGSLLFGSGPDWSLVPGRYLVGADQRSVSAPSLAVAQWASSHLPPGTHVAADRVNGALLADIGHVDPVTGISGLGDPSPLFFDPAIGRYELGLIRTGGIRDIVIDQRLTTALPLFGTYIEPGETKTPARLTTAELDKFESVPGVTRVYDNGPIQVYDLSALLGTTALPSPVSPVKGETGTNFVVLGIGLAVAGVVLVRLRRRRHQWRVTEHGVLRAVLGAVVVGYVVALVVVPKHAPSTAVGLGAAAVMLVVGLAATWRRPTDRAATGNDDGSADRGAKRPERWWLYGGAVLLVAGIALSTVAARHEWRPPDQLTLQRSSTGQTTAAVQLATAVPGTHLEVFDAGHAVMAEALSATTTTQTLVIPPTAVNGSLQVVLVAPGSSLSVSG